MFPQKSNPRTFRTFPPSCAQPKNIRAAITGRPHGSPRHLNSAVFVGAARSSPCFMTPASDMGISTRQHAVCHVPFLLAPEALPARLVHLPPWTWIISGVMAPGDLSILAINVGMLSATRSSVISFVPSSHPGREQITLSWRFCLFPLGPGVKYSHFS